MGNSMRHFHSLHHISQNSKSKFHLGTHIKVSTTKVIVIPMSDSSSSSSHLRVRMLKYHSVVDTSLLIKGGGGDQTTVIGGEDHSSLGIL